MTTARPLSVPQEARPSRLKEVCRLSAAAALDRLESAWDGLSSEEAALRLEEYGPNELTRARRMGFLRDVLERCRSPLVIQLLVIAAVSGAIGEWKSAVIVGVMVVLSVGLSYVLDSRSARAVESLGKRVQSRAVVLRDGREAEIRVSEVVPGDIVLLHAGAVVPADLRLLAAKDFFVNESALTGESIPVEKIVTDADPHLDGREAPACFLGTSVNSGSGRGLVVDTGTRTQFGAIATRLAAGREETSFDRGVHSFTWLMIRFMVVMVAAVFLIVGFTKGDWAEALLFGLSIAVGLTPEMLPMIVTVNLAKGALTMAKRKVIIKRLPAIQNFGAIDTLCTDKTGTLTENRVILERHVDLTGHESEDVLTYAYLNAFFQTGLRGLIDRTILEHEDLEVEESCRRVDELPFDFNRRRMSVVIDYEGDHVLICKGAVEEIYRCCSRYQVGDEVYPLLEMIRDNLFEEVHRLNADGFRVLAVAYREFPRTKTVFTTADESELVLLGYIAFLDPPKATARDALRALRETGVRLKVLTGDNALVTRKVCRDVGLTIDRLVDADELERATDEAFSQIVDEGTVFVKVTPMQKQRIVQSLRGRGHAVGFLGDGINDAPALKTADVGISVDTAVDVAKEAADIVLLEKSLLILSDGIVEGRRVFANIVKYIRMGASSNFGNMFSVLGASYLFPFLPMRPIQILTNNLLYDVSQTGIPTDHVDPDLVTRPLKWNVDNIKRFMVCIGPISSIFDYATYALMWFVFGARAFAQAAPAHQDLLARTFQTGWFVESLLTQTLIVHIIRTRRVPFFGSRASAPMTLTTLAVMAVGVWLPYSPFAGALSLVPLPASYWLWIGGFLATYAVLTHIVKVWFFRRYGGE
jgi:Mg2+-importing ATPase